MTNNSAMTVLGEKLGSLRMGSILLMIVMISLCVSRVSEGGNCSVLPKPANTIINVATVAELNKAVSDANAAGGNRTILVAKGTYNLTGLLDIFQPNITVRGATGNRDDVVLQGTGMTSGVPHVFLVEASHFTVADLTLGNVYYHGIQIQGEKDADDLLVHNVRIFNTGEQMLKVSNTAPPSTASDRGVVRCSLFEYTASTGPQWYIGGIDAHHAIDWEVRDNIFRNIRSPEARLAEYAIHFWGGSSNTLVERNIIANCDRGIGFGLDGSFHYGGLIRNNMIYTTRDTGIGLWYSPDTRVLNNTVYAVPYPSPIEYRFAETKNVVIRGNLTNGGANGIQLRNGASGTVSDNYTSATSDFFVDFANANLRLKTALSDTAKSAVVDKAPVFKDVVDDIDGRLRPVGSAPDLGAQEWGNGTSVIPPAAPGGLSVQ